MNRKKIILCSLFLMLVLYLLFGPRGNILKTDVLHAMEGSSSEHWLGTDNLGRDVYSLLMEGGLRTISVVFTATAIAFSLGTILGMCAAFGGPVLRSLIRILADFTLTVPSFIVALILTALFGFSPLLAGFVFGIGNMGEYENQAFHLACSLKEQEFIDAEYVLGLSMPRILLFHVFPNIARQLLVFLGNRAGNVTVQYAGLAFIGLGTDITNPDWGTMLYQYRSYLTVRPQLVFFPAAAIAVLTIFFHVMFDDRREDAATIYD